jgi:phospholipid/cholesterol/gamma-HCH transport system substrate-binding protein
VLYPYVVEGGFTVVTKEPGPNGRYNAHFGMVTTEHALCHRGYEGTDRREPNNGEYRKMKENTRCLESSAQSNARGAQNAPRAGANYRAPVAGVYDQATRKFRWTADGSLVSRGGSVTGRTDAGAQEKEAWQWLLLQPLTTTE